jgi:hypothetical protein
MKYIIYLFYRYYNKGDTIRIPYESSIFALLLLIFMNAFTLLICFLPSFSRMFFSNYSRVELYFFSLIGTFLGYLIINQLFPKKEIFKMINVSKNVKIHSWFLFFYIIFSFIILMGIITR